jgi:hypothetical protein
LNLKNVTNKNISSCLYFLNEDAISHSHNLLETKINFKTSYNNSHLFLMQFFEKFFAFLPSFVYFNDQYVFFFMSSQKNRLINAKYSNKKTAFFKKFTKMISFVNYKEPIRLDQLVKNLFQHIPIYFLEYKIEKVESKLISIYIFTNESYLKFALGRKGAYIKTINDLMHSCLDQRITLFIRSVGE